MQAKLEHANRELAEKATEVANQVKALTHEKEAQESKVSYLIKT